MNIGADNFQNILITGSSSGIGLHLTGYLREAGACVWALARRQQAAFAGGHVHFLQADVGNYMECATAAASLPSDTRLDAIIHCAGIQGEIGSAMTMSAESWQRVVQVNLCGTFNVIRAFYEKLMLDARMGSRAKVLCFSGGGATKSRPMFSAYAAAKTGVVRLVETLADEWRNLPVDINAIAPGALPTAMTQETLAAGSAVTGEAEIAMALKALAAGEVPWKKLTALTDHLLSPDSDGISGRLIAAQWDPLADVSTGGRATAETDLYKLRRTQ